MVEIKRMFWNLLQLGMFLGVPVFAGLSAPPSPALTDSDTKEIIQRIEAGNVNALVWQRPLATKSFYHTSRSSCVIQKPSYMRKIRDCKWVWPRRARLSSCNKFLVN